MLPSINQEYTNWGFTWIISTSQYKTYSFVKLEIIYGEYCPEYANYFGRPLRLKNPMYGMTNSGKLFSDELTN